MVRFIHFLNRYLKYVKIELATSIETMGPSCDPNHPNYYKNPINPATGLRMNGAVDTAGNMMGSNANDDYYRRSSSDDYHRSQAYQDIVNPTNTYNSPSYDPYNRY